MAIDKTVKSAGSKNKRPRRIMRSFKMDEISGVDVPAMEEAVVTIMKRKGQPGYNPKAKDPKKRGRATQTDENIGKGAALTSPDAGHSHLLMLTGPRGEELMSGFTEFEDGHSHPWIRMGSGEIVIGMSHAPDGGEPHTHSVAATSKAEGGEAETDAGGNEAGNEVGAEENETMTDKTKKAAEDQPTVEELQAQLAEANQIASLTDAEKSHYNALKALDDGDGAKEFLAKSADERKSIVEDEARKAEKKAKDDDPVEYTTIDGVELRKSAGAAFIAMAKSNDELRKRLDDSEAKREQDVLEKRAEDEFAHLPGTATERAALIKAAEGIEDESQRKAALNALKAQNDALATAFKTAGVAGVNPTAGTPAAELEQLAKAYQEKNDGTSYEQAYAAVLETSKGAELYAKSVN